MSKLETEKPHLCDSAPGVIPLDLSFNPDPDPDPHISTPCCFPTMGGDIVIAPPPSKPPISSTKDTFLTATANANRNLHTKEKGKLTRTPVAKTASTPRITGEWVMKDLVVNGVVLIPMTTNPLGRMGQMMRHFLYDTCNPTPGDIPETHLMARSMMMRT